MGEDMRQETFRATERDSAGAENSAAPAGRAAKAAEPTKEEYAALERAFQHFNKELFAGALPRGLITLPRRRGTYGYFSAARWDNESGAQVDEIALNPQYFRAQPLEEVLSTLVHEMTHLWQHHHGKPGRGRYHNRQWAEKMKELGLYPSDTGEPGGKETGDRVSHYILPDGAFAKSCRKLLERGFALPWKERLPEPTEGSGGAEDGEEGEENTGNSGKRVKYTCPAEDHLNAWAKPGVESLMCADHRVRLVAADAEGDGDA